MTNKQEQNRQEVSAMKETVVITKRKPRILKWLAAMLAGIMIGVGSTIAVGTGFIKLGKAVDFNVNNEQPTLENPLTMPGGATIEANTHHDMALMSTKIPKEEYATNGVSAQAESAYTLTATIEPDDAIDKTVDWSIAFKNANSAWARGKAVTDYVTLAPAADGALTAVVENKAEFGEQIVVKVTSRDNANAYATCRVEYLQRTLKHVFVAAQVGNTGSPFYEIGTDNYSSSAEIKLDFSYDRIIQPYLDVRKSTIYTRENTDGATYYTLKPTTQFLNSLKSITGIIPAPKSFEGGLTDVSGRLCAPIEFFSKSWGEAIYGTGATAPAAKNQLIRILQQDYGHYNNFNAYEVVMYDKKGGIQLAKYGIHFDLSGIQNQFRVENVKIDDTELMF